MWKVPAGTRTVPPPPPAQASIAACTAAVSRVVPSPFAPNSRMLYTRASLSAAFDSALRAGTFCATGPKSAVVLTLVAATAPSAPTGIATSAPSAGTEADTRASHSRRETPAAAASVSDITGSFASGTFSCGRGAGYHDLTFTLPIKSRVPPQAELMVQNNDGDLHLMPTSTTLSLVPVGRVHSTITQ